MGVKSDKLMEKAQSVSDRLRVWQIKFLEDLLAAISITSTGVSRTLASTNHVGAGVVPSTAGVKAVMITCVTGVEEIEGIVRPAGVYTFEPQKGEDTVGIITMNPLTGRIILDQLS